MKFTFRRALCALSLIAVSGAANAALLINPTPLESRLDGQAIYDPNSNLTWLADANANNGAMTWEAANSWAASLTLGGFDDWRLPTTAQPDASCDDQFGSDSYGYNCTGSEMGNLFYNVLGGEAGTSITTTHNDNFDLFSNVQSSFYWSATEYAPYTSVAWYFFMGNGYQYYYGKTNSYYAWAVRSGDVSAVPVPAAVWLFGSGLLGLFGLGQRRSANR